MYASIKPISGKPEIGGPRDDLGVFARHTADGGETPPLQDAPGP
jgi:hypothetical protein